MFRGEIKLMFFVNPVLNFDISILMPTSMLQNYDDATTSSHDASLNINEDEVDSNIDSMGNSSANAAAAVFSSTVIAQKDNDEGREIREESMIIIDDQGLQSDTFSESSIFQNLPSYVSSPKMINGLEAITPNTNDQISDFDDDEENNHRHQKASATPTVASNSNNTRFSAAFNQAVVEEDVAVEDDVEDNRVQAESSDVQDARYKPHSKEQQMIEAALAARSVAMSMDFDTDRAFNTRKLTNI